MRLTLVTPPAYEPIDVFEAAQQMRLDPDVVDQDNALIGQLITVATRHLDGRDGLLGRALIKQTWALKLPKFSSAIEIPFQAKFFLLSPTHSIPILLEPFLKQLPKALDADGVQCN